MVLSDWGRAQTLSQGKIVYCGPRAECELQPVINNIDIIAMCMYKWIPKCTIVPEDI